MAEQPVFVDRVKDCVARVAHYGVDALGPLFDLAAQRLVRFATAITRHQQDAEDAVQAVLVRLATEPELLPAADCPWSYLLRMVRNESLLVLRRKQRCATGGNLEDLSTYCPVDELEREESHRAVWLALRRLPSEQAEVVVLKIWEGMTFLQIGQILETSPHTAASRYQYALEKLSRQLSGVRRETRHE